MCVSRVAYAWFSLLLCDLCVHFVWCVCALLCFGGGGGREGQLSYVLLCFEMGRDNCLMCILPHDFFFSLFFYFFITTFIFYT